MKVLQIGTVDEGGGAAAVAGGLTLRLRTRGCRVWHAVGRKHGFDADVVVLPDDRRLVYRLSGYSAVQALLSRLAGRYPDRGFGYISRSLRTLTHPRTLMDRSNGLEDFAFPGTYGVLDSLDAPPDVVHCHNLHGGFFDLRALAWLSRRVPTVLTLHDMWLLTGHCAHSLGCERWRTGCGTCPDLNLYPAVRRDRTAENWRRKCEIYAQSRLYVATPSRWLFDKTTHSSLMPGVRQIRVIPNGVDLSIFRPAEKHAARVAIGVPDDVSVVLLTTGSRGSMWKDDRTLISAVERIAAGRTGSRTLFLAVGRESAVSPHGRAETRSVPYQTDPRRMAAFYQAADVYMHAARADTFPSAILEAMACGTPVVATAVGGIPEQIRSAEMLAAGTGVVESTDDATGVLVPPGDAARMSEAVLSLLTADAYRTRLGENAARAARLQFDLHRQADSYLDWYQTVIDDWKSASREPECAAQL